VNDPRSPEPRTAAGKLLLRQFPGPHMDSLILAIEEEMLGVLADWERPLVEQASSSDELRAALEQIASPALVDAPGGFYCPWCGTNVNVHGTTCPVFIARAALAPKPSAT
jgi:hypothetical protein